MKQISLILIFIAIITLFSCDKEEITVYVIKNSVQISGKGISYFNGTLYKGQKFEEKADGYWLDDTPILPLSDYKRTSDIEANDNKGNYIKVFGTDHKEDIEGIFNVIFK
jgi:hypothetical protein